MPARPQRCPSCAGVLQTPAHQQHVPYYWDAAELGEPVHSCRCRQCSFWWWLLQYFNPFAKPDSSVPLPTNQKGRQDG